MEQAAVAAVTERLILGTGVTLLIQRDVINTAKEVATLDLISAGRFVFGVGAGWNREEMADHGTDPRTRGALLDEQLDAIRKDLDRGSRRYHGRFIDFDPMYAWPKPVQRPHPPIYLGGGQAAAERAIRNGVGSLPAAMSDPAAIPAQLSALHGNDLPVTVAFVATDPALIDGYAEAGAQRSLFGLPTLPASETLRALDDIAKPAGHHLG